MKIKTIEEYRSALAGHDWWYMMSDDPTVYRAGKDVALDLNEARKELDADWAIWDRYAPAEFKSKGDKP